MIYPYYTNTSVKRHSLLHHGYHTASHVLLLCSESARLQWITLENQWSDLYCLRQEFTGKRAILSTCQVRPHKFVKCCILSLASVCQWTQTGGLTKITNEHFVYVHNQWYVSLYHVYQYLSSIVCKYVLAYGCTIVCMRRFSDRNIELNEC